jgi:pantoate--beta-alanine ligase
MNIISSLDELRSLILSHKKRSDRIGFVPTMGFLHDGHASLMDIARKNCDILVVSIFVNPLQFGPNEDLDQYPRDPEGDALRCEKHGVDILFIPRAFYPPNRSTVVQVNGLSSGLCGQNRPTHFEGVTTVVARLFGLVQPDISVFGEKDFQQLAIIRRMVDDLAIPVTIIGGPLVRDADGLALSSRNRYLTKTQRRRALTLSKCLQHIKEQVKEGNILCSHLLELGHNILDVDALDYLEIRHPDTLMLMPEVNGPARVFVAARIGSTRLIDNLELRT